MPMDSSKGVQEVQRVRIAAREVTPPSEQSTEHSVLTFDNTKAGLDMVDKKKTEEVLTAASLGTPFYLNEKAKLLKREKKVEQLLEACERYRSLETTSPLSFRQRCASVDQLEAELLSQTSVERIYVHIDMDMFYAAVEEKKNPSLASLPLGVGTLSMLSTTNYVARRYGVRAGMPGFMGRKLCPELVIVPTDIPTCKEEAKVVRSIAAHYDSHFTSFGLDELCMELTPYIQEHNPSALTMSEMFTYAEGVVEECRAKILEATRLTASAGIAATSSLAKMASNYNKPNGQHCLSLETLQAIKDYLRSKPVRNVLGIGKCMEFLLHGIQIRTLGDIYDNRYLLSYLFPGKTFAFLLSSSIGCERGCDDGEGNASDNQKSVGEESTFFRLESREAMESVASRHLCAAVRRLKKYELYACQLVVKVKWDDFTTNSFSRTVDTPTDDEVILKHLLDAILSPLLHQFNKMRLLGVRLDKLVSQSSSTQQGVQRTLSGMLASFSAPQKAGRKRLHSVTSDDEVLVLDDADDDASLLSCDASGSSGSDVECVLPPPKNVAEEDRNAEAIVVSD